MLHVGNEHVPDCSGVNRRSFLQAGAAGLAGLTLPTLLGLEAAGAVDPAKAKIKNCITIFLVGSPGHLDTFDMKPDAPSDVRGKFKPIDTNVSGVQICEHFPQMARMMCPRGWRRRTCTGKCSSSPSPGSAAASEPGDSAGPRNRTRRVPWPADAPGPGLPPRSKTAAATPGETSRSVGQST